MQCTKDNQEFINIEATPLVQIKPNPDKIAGNRVSFCYLDSQEPKPSTW